MIVSLMVLLSIGMWSGRTIAGDLEEDLARAVHEYQLDNGLTLLVLENHDSPTIGVVTAFSVGAAEERPGINGVTHILEHMLFKGTRDIGTSDWEAEKVHYDRIEELTLEAKRESAKGRDADENRIAQLLEERAGEMEAAKEYAVDNELWGLYEEAGGRNLNAFTSYDGTAYIQALPANRLELWMFLESERLRAPVLRQFYTEVQNVLEERRMRTDASPDGKLGENFLAVAFDAHWYGYPIIGYPADIESLTRTETEEWFRVYYAPNRLTLAIVGDVDPDAVHDMARSYFGDIPPQDPPEPVETFDLPKEGMRRIEVEYDAEPSLIMGWHKPNIPSPQDAALRVVAEILSGGRSSRFEKVLKEELQLVASIDADHETPGDRWDNLFVIDGKPLAPHTTQEVEDAVWEQLERLKREPVSDRELAKAKNRIRAQFVRETESNFRLAIALGYMNAIHGDWRIVLDAQEAVAAVTADDVRSAARSTFRRSGTIVATLVKPAEEVDPEREAAGLAMVEDAVAALGGMDRLGGVRRVEIVADVAIQTPGGELPAKANNAYQIPDAMASTFEIFGQAMESGLTRSDAWRTSPGGVEEVQGEDLRDLRSDLEREMFLMAYPAVAGDFTLQSVDAEEGEDFRLVQARGPSGKAFTVAIAHGSNLPSRITYEGKHPQTGDPATIRESFDDFREVSGILRPHRIVLAVDGTDFTVSTVTQYDINGDIPADRFVRPTD
jgi:predicted Zn-dependent peptidase